MEYHTHTFPTATPAEVTAGTRDDVAVSPASLSGAVLPSSGPPSAHVHPMTEVTGLDAALAERVRGTMRLTVSASPPLSPSLNDVWIDIA